MSGLSGFQKKIEKLPIVLSDTGGNEKKVYWDIYNCPVIDDGNNLKFLILIAREVKNEEILEVKPPDIFSYSDFQNKRFSIVLRKLDKLLIRNGDADISYPKVFKIIGEALKIERQYYYKISSTSDRDELNDSNYSKWVKVDQWTSGINPYESDLETIEGLMIPLSGRKEFCKNESDIIDENLKKLFFDNGIKSLCVLPIFLKNEFHGILGVEDCVNERVWSAEEKDFMKCVVSLLAACIEK